MTEKKSIKATLSGLGASSLSVLGICCGGGVCASSCGAACVAPVASVLGVSTAGLSTWASHLLPVFTAISAAAFTSAYYSIYKQSETPCCDEPSRVASVVPSNRWSKPAFWLGLVLTVGLFSKAIRSQASDKICSSTCDISTSSCASDAITTIGLPSCKPADCTSKLTQDEDN